MWIATPFSLSISLLWNPKVSSCTSEAVPSQQLPFSPSQFLANTCRFSVSMSPTTWDTPLDWDQTAFASGDWLVSPSLLSLWFVHQQGVSAFLCWLRLDLVLRTWIRHHLLSRSLLGFWAASISWLLWIALLEGGDVHLPSRAFQFLWRRSEVSGLGPVVVAVLAVCRTAPVPFPWAATPGPGPSSRIEVFQCLHTLAHTCIFLNCGCLHEYGFDWHFLYVSFGWAFFSCIYWLSKYTIFVEMPS